MSDFENNNPLEQQNNPPASQPAEGQPGETQPVQESVQPSAPQQEPAYTEKPVPHLTLEPDLPPDPPAPDHTGPHFPGSTAEPFHMPEPPRAPEPASPYSSYQAQPSYGAPQYTQQEQQAAPQYQPPQYSQAPQQPYYPYPPQQYNTPPAGYAQKSRLAAGLLAIMLGVFGVHNFYLGFNTRGTIQLVLSLAGGLLTCGVATVAVVIWAFIEGVMLLSAQPSRMYDGNGVILRD